jgi:hypothetical protein
MRAAPIEKRFDAAQGVVLRGRSSYFGGRVDFDRSTANSARLSQKQGARLVSGFFKAVALSYARFG